MSENNYIKTGQNNFLSNTSWLFFTIIAINTLFGLQLMSSFFSLLVNFFRERPAISLLHVAIYAFVAFSTVFLAGFLFKFLKKHILFLILIFSTAALRFLIQVCSWGPLSLAASALGTALWVVSLAFFISLVQQRKIKMFFTFFPALIFGFAINTGLNGLFGTWDMIWRLDEPTVIFFLAAVTAVQVVITLIVRNTLKDGSIHIDGSKAVFYSLVAIMPFIFLQLYQFQNIAALNAKAGFDTAASLSIIIFSNLIALAFTYLIGIKPLRILLTVISAIILVLSFWPEISGSGYICQVILGNLAGWWLVLVVLNRAVSYTEQNAPWKNVSAMAVSGILLFIFAFIYYGSYDINLPFKSWMIPVFISAMVAVFGMFSVFTGFSLRNFISARAQSSYGESGYQKTPFFKRSFSKYVTVFLMLLLFIIPAILLVPVGYKSGTGDQKQKDTIRLMHYNIHQGFNIDGYQDLESIARVIEGNGVDILCLNEVSRGWVINGSADVYLWLAERLGMDYKIFMPASDLIWGNAILSKYPLNLIKSGFLPRMDAPLRRSYIYANVNLDGAGIENINLASTHIHHIEGEGEIRQAQVKALLEELEGVGRTVICGDFNAVTGEKEIQMMADAGFIDSQLALGKQDKLTWVHYEPYERIDYIWVTPDIEISDLQVTYSKASDHLPVSLLFK